MNAKLPTLRYVLCSVVFFALAGCKTLPPAAEAAPPVILVQPAPVPASSSSETEDLLAYFQRVRLLPSAELPRLMADLNVLAKTPHREVQRAILFGFMRGSGDLARAMAALDGVVKSSDAEAEHLKPLAYFLSANYSEWRRLDEAADKQSQQLKDAQRRADQLSQKLEDLKAIERQLPTRPRMPATPGTGSVPPAPPADGKQ
ncbi:hypothetical protein ACO0LO_07145 [Undibacterium sp. TJN25]|uniref:hypothetical protein n=1 Tax=Undibacterium sp. TJN25 TaxID=3413056 RepID=UPI003BF1EDF3